MAGELLRPKFRDDCISEPVMHGIKLKLPSTARQNYQEKSKWTRWSTKNILQ